MSNRIYITSDLHFCHPGVLNFRPQFESVEEHDETIIDNWNHLVRKNDTVWVLGDVSMGNRRGLEKVGQLNGLKRLVMGNHDTRAIKDYAEYFNTVHGSLQKDSVVFTHIPVHPRELGRYVTNVHGHLHNEQIQDDSRYINVCLEHTDMKPVLLEDILLHILKD